MCFTHHGLAGTTIEMICEATETNVGSLYHHFGNKDAIIRAVYFAGLVDFSMLTKSYLSDLGVQQTATAEHAQADMKFQSLIIVILSLTPLG
jgi:AcrR family transcriptional regulator